MSGRQRDRARESERVRERETERARELESEREKPGVCAGTTTFIEGADARFVTGGR